MSVPVEALKRGYQRALPAVFVSRENGTIDHAQPLRVRRMVGLTGSRQDLQPKQKRHCRSRFFRLKLGFPVWLYEMRVHWCASGEKC